MGQAPRDQLDFRCFRGVCSEPVPFFHSRECRRLRVKDVCFDEGHIVVRSGKGDVDRITVLPERAREPLREQIEVVRRLHQRDLEDGFGAVYLRRSSVSYRPGRTRRRHRRCRRTRASGNPGSCRAGTGVCARWLPRRAGGSTGRCWARPRQAGRRFPRGSRFPAGPSAPACRRPECGRRPGNEARGQLHWCRRGPETRRSTVQAWLRATWPRRRP
jgi:hypothetical protein